MRGLRAAAASLSRWHLGKCALVGCMAGVVTGGAIAAGQQVSQKGRTFNPLEMSISAGESVQVVNDDGDLIHHAFIRSDRYSFDSGDLKPGSSTSIPFPVAGTFNVFCAIHPKMKLIVHVR